MRAGRRERHFRNRNAVPNANFGRGVAREEEPNTGNSKMNDESHSPAQGTRQAEQALSAGLAALSRVTFSDSDAGEIFRVATAAVGGLAPCQVEASYRSVNGEFVRFPPSQPAHPDIERHRRSGWDGHVDAEDGRWGWAFPLQSPTHRQRVFGGQCRQRTVEKSDPVADHPGPADRRRPGTCRNCMTATPVMRRS